LFTATKARWLIQKYDSTGTLLWSRTYHSGSAGVSDSDRALGLTVNKGNGDVLVVGAEIRNDLGQGWNARLRRLDTNGNLVQDFFIGNTAGDEVAYSIALDSVGNYVVCGDVPNPGQAEDFMVRKYAPAGTLLWSRTFSGNAGALDYAIGMSQRPDDSTIIAGAENTTGQAYNWAIRKLDGTGALLWTKTMDSPYHLDDHAYKVAVDSSGAVFAVGDSTVTGQSLNWLVQKYGIGANLAASLTATPTTIPLGYWTSLVLTVTNQGCTDANNVTATVFVGPGGPLVEWISGPVPASVPVLSALSSVSFTWTYSASGKGTATFTTTATGTDAVSLLPVSGSASATVLIIDVPRRVLFYGPTAGGLELTTPNILPTVWDEATWASKTTADFRQFDAIVFGDVPACHASATYWDVAVATRDAWSPAIRGNVIVIGTSVNSTGQALFAHQAVLFAADSSVPGPGLYVSLSCLFASSPGEALTLLDGIGPFTVGGTGVGPCVNAVHKTAVNPYFSGFTDASLSGWGCSTREAIYSWPDGFMPLAIGLSGTAYTACDGTKGFPYIVANGLISPCPTPVVHKSASPDNLVCSNPLLTYTVSWSNAGNATIQNLTINDTLPNGTTYVKPSLSFWAQPDWLGAQGLSSSAYASAVAGPWTRGEPPNGSGIPRFMRWVVGRVAPGMSGYLSYSVLVSTTLVDGADIQNSVSATQSGDSSTYLSENVHSYQGFVTFTKTASASYVAPGDIFTYTIKIGNSCGETLTCMKIWDTLPAGVTFMSASGGGAYDGAKVDWSLPDIGEGDATFVDVTVQVDGSAPDIGPNFAEMDWCSGTGAPRPRRRTNSTWVFGRWAVVMGHKEMSPPAPICQGSRLTYAVSWSNAGNMTVDSLVITDTLPNGTVYHSPSLFSWTQTDAVGVPVVAAESATGWAGPWTLGEPPDATGPPLILRWTVERAAPGKSGFLHYAVDVSTTLPSGAMVLNRASLGGPGDPQTRLTEEVGGLAIPLPALAVGKTHSPAAPFPSGPVTYTILVSNTSLATVTAIKIVDTLSTHVAYVSQTFQSDDPRAKFTFTVGPPLAWTGTITLGPWDSATVTISGTRDACYAGMVSNTAWVWSAGAACSATEMTGVDSGFFLPALAVSVRKDVAPAAPVNGGPVSYRIMLTNTGVATITSVRITDTLPAAVLFASQVAPLPLVFAQTGPLLIWTGASTIKPGATLTVTVTGTASLCAVGSVSNTAWTGVSDGCRFAEAIGSTAFALSAPILPAITVAKTLVTASPLNGGPAKFRITVRNTSSATIDNVLITDTLPASLTYSVEEHPLGLVFASPGGGLVSWSGPYSITPGKSLTVTVTGTVGICFEGNVSNTAWALASASCAGVEGSAVAGFDLVRPLPDLVISKTALPAAPVNGGGVSYRITVSNLGLATVTSLLITDTLPIGFNYVADSHPGWMTFANTAGLLSWSGTVTMGFAGNYTVTVTGQASLCLVGTVSNTAWVLGRFVCGDQQKSVAANFDLSTPVLPVIAVSKSFTPSSPRFNMPVSYRVSVVNNSVATLTNIIVVDTLPPSVGYVSEQHPAGIVFSNTGGILSWAGPVSVGPWRVFSVTVTGVNLCYTGEVTNTAWAMANNPCGSDQGISSTSYTIATPLPALTVAKTVTPLAPKNGDVVSYRILVTNTSAATVTDVHISDTLPAEIGYMTEAHAAGLKFTLTGSTLSWTGTGIQLLGPGKTLTVTITGLASWCHLGPVSNTAWVYGGNACGTAEAVSNRGFTLSTPAVPSILVSKMFTPAKPANDGPVSYRIVVANTGAGTVTQVLITDTLPPEVSYLSEAHPAGLAFTNSAPLFSWSGAVSIGPGRSLTVTVTGRAAQCYTGPVSNTAWAQATTLCGLAEGISATAYNLAPPLPAFSIAKTVAPAVPKNGDVVRYRIVVTNTSLATVTDVHITDTLPSAIAFMSEAHPGALSFSANGSLLSWDASAASLLAPGKSFTVTVTGLAGWCYLGLVSNTAWVFGGNACGTDERIGGNDFVLSTPLIETLSVRKTYTPAVPANGGPITYRIVVANTGTGTLNNFLVTDTLPSTVTYGGESHPAGMAFTNVPPILAWAGAVPLGPGRAYTFTVTGTSSACFTGAVSNTAWAAATGLCAPSEGTSTTAYGLTAPGENIPATAFLQQRVSKGQWFTVTMTATNTGATDVDGFTPYINPFRGGPLVDLRAGPVPAGPLLLTPGAAVTFTWTYSASGTGLVAFSVTGVGRTCGATPVLAVAPVVSATIEPPANLAARWVAFPAQVSIGQNFLLTMTVTNTGSATALGVDISAIRQTGGGGASPAGGPNPALSTSLAGGASRTFTWTMTGATSGSLVFSATVAGFDANSGLSVSAPPLASNVVIVQKAAALSATLFSYAPPIVCTGRSFLVTMTVTNTGEATANAVNAGALRLAGSGSVVLTAGPMPALPVVLAGGASKTFTWTFTGSLAGSLDISTTVTGTDANAGWAVTTGPIATSPVGVFTPGSLVSGLAVRKSVSVGQVFTVDLTVTNTGGSPVTGVVPSFSVPAGGGLLNGPTGPVPAGPLTIPGLTGQTFLYTFTATGDGVVSFAGGAAGTACYTTPLATSAAGISSTVLLAANLQARISVSAATVCTGSSLEVRMSVTNTGGAAADFVRAAPLLITGLGSAVLVSGPASVLVPGGSSVNLVWLYTPANPGPIEFSTTALGLDINSGATLTVGPLTSNSSTVLATGGLDISVIAPATVFIGSPDRGLTRPDIFSVTLSVTNTGTAPVVGFQPADSITAGGALVNGPLGPLPNALLSLAAGSSTAFSWSFTATAVGSFEMLSRLTYGICGGPLTDSRSATVQILNPLALSAQMLVVSSPSGLDELVTVIFEITSIGSTLYTAENVTFSGFKYSGLGQVELVSAPPTTSGATLASGAKAQYKWVFRTLRGGPVTFTATAVSSNGAPPVPASGLLDIVEAGRNLNDMWIYPNPFDWTKAINGTLKFRRMPPFSKVQIFTVAGETVTKLDADFNGMAEWDGRNSDGTRVAPAVYLWLAKAPNGKIRRGKVQVAR